MRNFVCAVFFILLFFANAEAQKIKYKNLFPILQSKDYKTAEPQLLKFLEENDDEANAYFYLGEIITSKIDTIQIFPTTTQYDSMVNEAIKAYKKSMALIDDREIRKNDEYYTAYNRRYLRTGKFAIKISDIQLDYENKIKQIIEKKEAVGKAHMLLDEATDLYSKLTASASNLLEAYPDESAFLLRVNSDSQEALDEVKKRYSDFADTYKKFIDELKSLNHPDYNPSLNLIAIVNWTSLKALTIDFSNFSITVQDYLNYLIGLDQKLKEEILPLKELLYKTDADLTSAISTYASAEDSAKIGKILIPEKLKAGLNTHDKSGVVINLLKYKELKATGELLKNANFNPVLSDSTNIYQKANLVEKFRQHLALKHEVIERIEKNLSERAVVDFQIFMDKFEPSINPFVTTEKTIAEKTLDSIKAESEFMAQQIQFFKYDMDSIYLTSSIAEKYNSDQYITTAIELDSMLVIGGVFRNKPFLATAGFDMRINALKEFQDSTYSISTLKLLEKKIIANFKTSLTEEKMHHIDYLTMNLEEIWKFEYYTNDTLDDAKVEASIYFLYDQEGDILVTLNSQGEKIGN